ncbi:antibiotic biosynthesis monooxygenase [Actinokineospora xionganensis]|uniref:Antibiotic biosynthesis monooxygenase n=1 Tax=Actinokineospora xionganensis TaxID=2684470 RepID=A0ABR7KZC5_9PSEU|nr:antibiotic biosynthesis monooxygenase [Actinokineospora xionganensis]MBC6445725.1 antibiotic biosynthesis monooxygenase [Actinokineospora xionganensis]
MFARSTTVQGRPENIDAGIANIRDQVMPTLRDMEGFVGISLLADRQSGRCIATTAWETEETMRASEPKLRRLREQTAEMLGARPQVDEWEIAVLHRDHTSRPGACVRATWMRFDADKADQAVQTYKMTALPAMEEFDGFCSASLLMDRESGVAVSSVTYDSPEAMERARTHADTLRTGSGEEAGVDILDVVEFELALAHLRVPEMA